MSTHRAEAQTSETSDAHTNALIHETSPYLLQHAHNPVDWRPWSDDAIAAARDRDVLIFLSVGYSTCYWCHVMERESFEDASTAEVLNERFVPIKVDREERPDVDEIYMMAVQAMTGRGGWPMSVWIDPHTLRPVYAGTYFPRDARHGMPAFVDVLNAVAAAWQDNRAALESNGERLAAALERELATPRPVVALDAALGVQAAEQLLASYDADNGGFSPAPKFPQPAYLELLLGVREMLGDGDGEDSDQRALRERIDKAVTHTLDRMATGGMYDQVGGGFHRYSTDADWLVPHFEKMLYDNGQLLSIYATASEVYDDPFYAEVARETAAYVLREMRDADTGAFYSAQDAEVNAREGLNYLWQPNEVADALGEAGRDDLVAFALDVYGLDGGPNFRDPHHADEPARNVLFLADRPDRLARQRSMDQAAFDAQLRDVNAILLAARDQREQPGLDDKVIASWNGLMIRGLADAGRILGEDRLIAAAGDAASYVWKEMRSDEGDLLRTARSGRVSGVRGFLEDHAAFAWGLVALHRASGEDRWLERATEVVDRAVTIFEDGDNGGFFDTRADQEDLLFRTKTSYDGALPSGNGMLLRVLTTLHETTGAERYLALAQRSLAAQSAVLARTPTATSHGSLALLHLAAIDPGLLPRGTMRDVALRGLTSLSIDRDTVRVSEHGSERAVIQIELEDGVHLNAHEPGHEQLIGLLVHIVGGEGVVAHAEYPPPQPYNMGLFDEPINIYDGTVRIPVRFERVGPAEGNPRLAIRWQACTDTACLEPQEFTFDLQFDVDE